MRALLLTLLLALAVAAAGCFGSGGNQPLNAAKNDDDATDEPPSDPPADPVDGEDEDDGEDELPPPGNESDDELPPPPPPEEPPVPPVDYQAFESGWVAPPGAPSADAPAPKAVVKELTMPVVSGAANASVHARLSLREPNGADLSQFPILPGDLTVEVFDPAGGVLANVTKSGKEGAPVVVDVELTSLPTPGAYLVRLTMLGVSAETPGIGDWYEASLYVDY